MNKTLIFLASLSVLISCKGGGADFEGPDFRKVREAEVTILSDELMYSPSCLIVKDGVVIVSGFDVKDKNSLFVYSKETGQLIKSGVKIGRGPSETIAGYRDVRIISDSLVFFDIIGQSRLSFTLDDFLKDNVLPVCKAPLEVKPFETYASETPDGRKVTMTVRSFLDRTSDLPARSISIEGCGTYEGSPISDEAISFNVYTNPHFAFSPDGRKAALSISEGMVLETFDISGDITEISTTQYLPVRIVPRKEGSYEMSDRFVFGVASMCASNRRIYAAYDGTHYWKDYRALRGKPGCPPLFNNVAVFDWKGRPVEMMSTTYRINLLAVDDNNDLYAVVENSDGQQFLAGIL